MNRISERDWKRLRKMKPEVLEEVCTQVFIVVRELIDGKSGSNHKKYLELFRLMRKHDCEISEMFDDLKRSNAMQKVAAWRKYGFLTDEALSEFSEETRSTVEFLDSL